MSGDRVSLPVRAAQCTTFASTSSPGLGNELIVTDDTDAYETGSSKVQYSTAHTCLRYPTSEP